MSSILVPVSGSSNSNVVIPHVIRAFHGNRALEIHLLTVRPPLSSHAAGFATRKNLLDFYREQGEERLLAARKALDGYGVPYRTHIEVGDTARLIAAAARSLRCERIVMSAARKSTFARVFDDSMANQVLDHATVPVEVIAGETVSRLERYGVPAGIGATLAMVLLATAD
jgi:nucleotide-binding universal stress UspA family protein